jgi:hypothetical protein
MELTWTLESITRPPVITLRWTKYRSQSIVPLLLSVYPLLRNMPSDLLPSNRGPSTVDCVTSGMCLPSRCLAMVTSVTVWILLFTLEWQFSVFVCALDTILIVFQNILQFNYSILVLYIGNLCQHWLSFHIRGHHLFGCRRLDGYLNSKWAPCRKIMIILN